MEEVQRKLGQYKAIHKLTVAPWRVRLRNLLFERTSRNIARVAGANVEHREDEPLDKFEVVVLVALVVNMLLLALYQPLDPDSSRTVAVTWINFFLAVCFVGEAIVRFVCFGHPVFTKDVWNAIDLLVIIVSVVSAGLDLAGISIGRYTVLRTIRVFRPLRSVVTLPAVKTLVVSMISAVRSLSDVALLYLLFLTSFSIIGVSQFSGLLRSRCVSHVYFDIARNASHPLAPRYGNFSMEDFVCGGLVDRADSMPPRIGCSPSQVCDLVTGGNRFLDGYRCPYGYTCAEVGNPFFGMISFDSLPQALLTLFVSVTGELWFTICVMLMDAFDITAAYYFFAVLVIGMFFIVNLSVVLITISFESTTAYQQQKVSRLLRRKMGGRSDTTTSHMTASNARLRNRRLRIMSMMFPSRRRALTTATGMMDDGRSAIDLSQSMVARRDTVATQHLPEELDDDDLGVPLMPPRRSVMGGDGMVSTGGDADEDEVGMSIYDQELIEREAADGALGDGGLTGYSNDEPIEDAEPLPEDQLPIWSDNTAAAKEYDSKWEERMKRVPGLQRLRGVVQSWFDRDYVSHVVNALIVLNILFMAMAHYGMPQGLEDFLTIGNYVFTACFLLEFIIRLLHFGPHKYFRKPVNILDLIVLVVSVLDVSSVGTSFPSIRAFRSVRLLKVLKSFPGVLRWAVVIMVSLKASALLMITIFVFNYVAACFGMQMFGGEFCDLAWSDKRPDNTVAKCMNRPRANFDTIGQAMLTAFQVTTGDEWDFVMYNGMRAVNPIVAVGFVVYFVISSYVLVNILVGILLSGPSPAEVNSLSREIFETDVKYRNPGLNQKAAADEKAEAEGDLSERDKEAQAAIDDAIEREKAEVEGQTTDLVITADGVMVSLSAPDSTGRDAFARHANMNEAEIAKQNEADDFAEMTRLWRERLRWLLTHPHFETSMLWLICISCIAMAFENPLAAPDTGTATVLRNTDIAITAVFVVEVLLNCFAFGIIKGEQSYLRRDKWNIVDLTVVLLSLIGVIGQYAIRKRWLRVTLSIRAIRPLRFVKRSRGLRTVFNAFVRSIVPLRNILVLGLMIWTCWGLMGVQLFMGAFYSCTDPSLTTKSNCTATAGAAWENADLHFDNLAAAFLSLFTLASLDGWTTIMYDGIDSVGPDVAPDVNRRPEVSLYFVSFVLVGSYFLMNLVVSVVIDTYNQEKARLGDKCVYLSESQNAYVRSHRRMIRGVPHVFFDQDQLPEWRKKLRAFVYSREFRIASMTCIVANCLLFTVIYYGAPQELEDAVFYCSFLFALAFVAEITLKLVAVGPRHFMESRFNRFDLVITIFCLVGVLGEMIFQDAGFRFIFKVLRIISLFRLLRNAGRLRNIINRFSFALYGLANVSALLFLVIFIYAIMGMRSFGLVKWGEAINAGTNYTNLLRSVLILLQSLTGGNWTSFMAACALSGDSCDPHINDCGVDVFSQFYFVSFMAMAHFILVNLFIAVILDCFIATNYSTEMISKEHVTEFFDRWFDFDSGQDFHIPGRELLPFLRSISLDNPLGLGYVPPELRVRHEFAFIRALRLQEVDGFVELQSMVMSICRLVFGVALPDSHIGKLQAQADRRFRRSERERRRGIHEQVSIPALHRVAVSIIEYAYRDFRKRKQSRGLLTEDDTRDIGKLGATTTAIFEEAAVRLQDLREIIGDEMTFVGDGATLVPRVLKQQQQEEAEAHLPPQQRAALAMLRREERAARGTSSNGRRGERGGDLDDLLGDGEADPAAKRKSSGSEAAPAHMSDATRRLLDEARRTKPRETAVAMRLIEERAEARRQEAQEAAEAAFALDKHMANARRELEEERRRTHFRTAMASSNQQHGSHSHPPQDDDELHSTLFGSLKYGDGSPIGVAAAPAPGSRSRSRQRPDAAPLLELPTPPAPAGGAVGSPPQQQWRRPPVARRQGPPPLDDDDDDPRSLL